VRIERSPQPLRKLNEALGLGVARLRFELAQSVEQTFDEFLFLRGHRGHSGWSQFARHMGSPSGGRNGAEVKLFGATFSQPVIDRRTGGLTFV
jgi:hypothetical protein